MRLYLLTDPLTGEYTWTAGGSLHDAMVTHENARRARESLPPLSEGIKIGHTGYINAWVGETNVVKKEGV